MENLYSDKEIPFIFSQISNPYLKICYDTGHRNFLTPEFEICKQYGKNVSVLHIHENNGLIDEHKKLSYGSNVYNKLVKELSFLNSKIDLSNEIKYNDNDCAKYLKSNLDCLNQLEKIYTRYIEHKLVILMIAQIKETP